MATKFWMPYSHKNEGKLERFLDKDEAIKAAKLRADAELSSDPVFLLETVKVFRRPLPKVEEIDL